MKIINTRAELIALRDELGLRENWHEPDEQGVSAFSEDGVFDNAMCQPDSNEAGVVLTSEGMAVAWVNLALLFAFATGFPG